MASGATLNLQEITLTSGYAAGDGGAIQNNGTLTLVNAIVRESRTDENHNGGAIVSTGPLTITGSLLEGNKGANGGALFLSGELGDAEITNSALRDNTMYGDYTQGRGGAILLWDGADVSLHGSILEGNWSVNGGAIYNEFANSSITMDGGSVLSGNWTRYGGGGIYNSGGSANLTNVTLSRNSAGAGGGGIYNVDGSASLTNITLSDNSAIYAGGGLFNVNGSASLTNVTLSGNSASDGGGICNTSNGSASLTNVTLSGNSAEGDGGGIFAFSGAVTLTNVTLSGNSGPSGGGIYRSGGTLTLKNVVLARGASGANCSGGVDYLSGIVSSGFNLSSDDSCGLDQAGDLNLTNPHLGPLANNGGFTQTHMPMPSSPAIDTGTGLGAPATDQRGLPRPSGLATDKGAVERQPIEWTKVYLPLVLK